MTGIQNTNLDKIVNMALQLDSVLGYYEFNPHWFLHDAIKVSTDYYARYEIEESNQKELLEHQEKGQENFPSAGVGITLSEIGVTEIDALELEIRDNFLRLGESKLQDRYANYLSDKHRVIASLYKKVFTLGESVLAVYDPMSMTNRGRKDRTEEQDRAIIEGRNFSELEAQVAYWRGAIEDNVRSFAPETYRQIQIGPIFQATEQGIKKVRKKEQLTQKQQFVLAELFGLHDHPLLSKLNPQQRATILGELLNRNVHDTRYMLEPETSRSDEKLNWNTDFERAKVNKFLRDNGLELP